MHKQYPHKRKERMHRIARISLILILIGSAAETALLFLNLNPIWMKLAVAVTLTGFIAVGVCAYIDVKIEEKYPLIQK